MADHIAASGYWSDIQDAIDLCTTGDTVHIPSGTYNFVNVDEGWAAARVTIPAGVNLFGALTSRDEDGQVTEWNTVLNMPWDVPDDDAPVWFKVIGDGSLGVSSRISDIKLIGYRTTDAESVTGHRGIRVEDTLDFRIDHCCLEHTTGGGIVTFGAKCSGVIDHCKIYNIYGVTNLANYLLGNVGYGVASSRGYFSIGYGFEDMDNVLGKYTDHSVYIEDCYFSRWRHCTTLGHGAHHAVRYCVFDNDFDSFTIDMHGLRDSGENRWGGRCGEYYHNTFTNKIGSYFPDPPAAVGGRLAQFEGGCGVWFNNTVDTTYDGYHGGIVTYEQCTVPNTIWDLTNFYLWSPLGTHTEGVEPYPWSSGGVGEE